MLLSGFLLKRCGFLPKEAVSLATHKSAEKRARQNLVRSVRNSSRKTRIKSTLKKLHDALKNNDKAAAEEVLKKASSVISKGASKGVVRKKTASRKISRLSKKVSALAS